MTPCDFPERNRSPEKRVEKIKYMGERVSCTIYTFRPFGGSTTVEVRKIPTEPAQVRWDSIGSQDAETARNFGQYIVTAARLAAKLNKEAP